MGNVNSLLEDEYHLRMYKRSENFSGKQINNFACVALCLKYTVEVAKDYIEEKMKTEYNSWSPNLKANFKSFCYEASIDEDFLIFTSFEIRNRLGINRAWNLSKLNRIYDSVLEEILNLHTNRNSRNFQWSSNSNSSAEPYWMLAKIFMPFGNNKSRDVYDIDALSVLDLLRNCRLFKDEFELEVIDKLCEARKAVMRLLSTDISDDKKEEFLGAMIDFVGTSCLSESRTKEVVHSTLERLKSGDVVVCDGFSHLVSRIRLILPPGTELSEEELLESTNEMVDTCLHKLKIFITKVKQFQCHLDEESEREIKKENEKFKRIGAAAGAMVTGGGAFAIVGTVGLGVVTVASAPIVVPVAVGATIGAGIAGVVGYVLGFVGGRAGGSVMTNVKEVK